MTGVLLTDTDSVTTGVLVTCSEVDTAGVVVAGIEVTGVLLMGSVKDTSGGLLVATDADTAEVELTGSPVVDVVEGANVKDGSNDPVSDNDDTVIGADEPTGTTDTLGVALIDAGKLIGRVEATDTSAELVRPLKSLLSGSGRLESRLKELGDADGAKVDLSGCTESVPDEPDTA